MAVRMELGRDRAGRPVVSASFVLAHAPAPEERLRDLVTQAVVALDLVARDAEGTVTETRVTVDTPDGPVPAVGTGPFGQVSVAFTLEGAAAGALLQSMVERQGGPLVRVEVSTASRPGTSRQVRIHLRRLWDVLDAHAGPNRSFRRVDLQRHVRDLVASGALTLVEADPATDDDLAGVADAVIRRAAGVLVPVATLIDPGPGQERYRLSDRRPGETDITLTVTPHAGPGPVQVAERALGDLLAEADAQPASFVNVVTAGGGKLTDLLPRRTLTGRRAGPAPRLLMQAVDRVDRIEPVVLAAGGSLAHVVRPGTVRLDTRLPVADVSTIALYPPEQGSTPGPLVGTDGPAFWPDRFDAGTSWYVPELTVVVPDPADPAATAAYRFDVTPAGHGLDGSEGIEAAITLTLVTKVPDDVRAAWQAAGSPHLVPVPSDALTVQLGVPFRDQTGAQQLQHHFADSMTKSDDFGADGGTLVVVFRLADQWARMAYGALSTPGFQPEPARVLVTSTYRGWRRGTGHFPMVQPDKVSVVLKRPLERPAQRRTAAPQGSVAVLERPARSLPLEADLGIAPTRVSELAKARLTVVPRLHANAELLTALWRERYEWAQFSAASSVTVLVGCAEHGSLYRRVVAGEEATAIGCQDVLRLGQATFRTYEPITVAAATGYAKVLRSLTRPGHFLLVPDRYRVGRFGPGAGTRAFRPQLLLTSVLDTDTAGLRAVLAATLEADVPPAVRSAIVDELRARSPEVSLDLPWAAGLTQTVDLAVPGHGDEQCVLAPTGFTVVLTLDVSDFLVVKTLLETAGLTGSVTSTLPEGLTVVSTVTLSLSEVAGPYECGPVVLRRDGGDVELTNRIGSRVAVTSLRAHGGREVAVARVLQPEESTRVAAVQPDEGEYDVVAVVESTRDTLEEVRIYVEDLEVEAVFVLAGSLGAALALEVAVTFLDHQDAEPVVLSGDHQQEARRYLLPLTSYVSDPTLQLVSTLVGADGARTSSDPVRWSLREQGAVIPVSVPSPTTPL